MKGIHVCVCLLLFEDMRDFAKSFYKSNRWQRMREYIYKRDRGLCQDCLKNGVIKQAEEVHHIIPLTPNNIDDASIALGESNLVSLCRECHHLRHKGVYKNKKKKWKNKSSRFIVDENGNVLTT